MSPAPSVRTFAPEEWQTYRDLRLRALAESPDAFGRTLAEEQHRLDTEWAVRLASGTRSPWDLPLLAEMDSQPIGLAWGRFSNQDDPEVASLYQMWVDPAHRRLGAGQMLLERVITWASAANAWYLDLVVTCGTPAMRMYSRAGFELIGERAPIRLGSKLQGQSMRLALRGRAA